jgi:hypothetical protein
MKIIIEDAEEGHVVLVAVLQQPGDYEDDPDPGEEDMGDEEHTVTALFGQRI